MIDVYWLEQTATEVRHEDDWLSARELGLLDHLHIPKRNADWRLGRWTAKRALAVYLDLPDQPRVFANIEVIAGDSGAPEVFFANRNDVAAISLSHRTDSAMCAIAGRGTALGCDLEVIEPHSDNFVADFFTLGEQELIASVPETDRPLLVTLLWSAKESTLKALHVGLRLDTRSVSVDPGKLLDRESVAGIDSKLRTSECSCGSDSWQPLQTRFDDGQVFHGWWQRDGSLLRTLVSSPAPKRPMLLQLAAEISAP